MSCGGDEDSLIGTWVVDSFTKSDCDDANIACVQFFTTSGCNSSATENCETLEYTFAESNVTIIDTEVYNGDFDMESRQGTYTKNDNVITFCFGSECVAFTLNFESHRLILASVEKNELTKCFTTLELIKQ